MVFLGGGFSVVFLGSVSEVSSWCLGCLSVVSRLPPVGVSSWCLGGVLVVFRLSLVGVSSWCLGGVSVVSRWCL